MIAHVHAHDHEHEHRRGGDGRSWVAERRGLLLALISTLVIFVAEVIGGWLSNSLALMADAGHMFSDAAALVLAFAALTFATRPATREKTYGWYRLEILAALLNGVVLVVISLGIMWEAWRRFFEPPEVQTGLMMTVAVIGLAANAFGLFFLHGHHHHSVNVRGAYLHVLGDLLSSVGVVAGGIAMWLTGAFWIDPMLSALIAVIITAGAWRLLRESVDVLLEGTPAGIDYEEVVRSICEVDGVESVHDLHIWSLTSGMHALSCHVEVKPERLIECGPLLDAVRHILAQRFDIDHTTVQVEPEGYQRRRMVRWHLGGESPHAG
jgi:cobalt-zinc-cadmium efflux system protein